MFTDISEKVINELKQVIEERDQCVLTLSKSFQTYWLRDFQETEFRISRLGDYQLLISRVSFKNRRSGTMTALLKMLNEYGKREGIKRIRIQSVETYEMMQFCLKNSMKPDHSNIWVDDVLMGDYDLEL